MDDLSTELNQTLGHLLEGLPAEHRASIIDRAKALLSRARTAERERCVRLCRYRADLWDRTAAGSESSVPQAREEARARRNESLYLADLLESETDPFPEADA